MSDNFEKLIGKLARSKPKSANPDRITDAIMERISKEKSISGRTTFIRSLAKFAAVMILLLSSGLLIMQEWQVSNNMAVMRDNQDLIVNKHQNIVKATDCKQLIKNTLRAVTPEVKIRIDKSKRIVEIEGESDELVQIESYLNSDLKRSQNNDGKFYLTENDIKAFGINCELF
jgi:hypothetical protein